MGNTMKKLAMVAGVVVLAISANANTITLGVGPSGVDVLGEVIPGYGNASQESIEMGMVNTLIPMGLSTSQGSGSSYVYRSGNSFGSLPTAITTSDVLTPSGSITSDGTRVTIKLGTSGYNYLVAKYDGPNGGAEVWDIASIAAGTTIYIPQFAQPDSTGTNMITGKYGITSWSMYNTVTTPSSVPVPEAASTVVLLGAALTSLSLIRRKISGK